MTEFADRLAAMEDEGSALLVTGAAADAAHTDVCAQMLAADSVEPRRRVVVLPNGALPVEPRLPTEGGAVPDTTFVTTTSGRAAAASEPAPDGVDVVRVDDGTLADLGTAIVDAVRSVQRRHGPLEPTELRLCLDSLPPLLDVYGERDVFQFLLVLNRFVRSVDALGHCHLPVDRTDYAACLLAPLFDAVVEVRARHDHAQQRWHLDDGATTSPWLPL